MVDAAHVKSGGRVPHTTQGGEGEHVSVTRGGVRPLKRGLYLAEEQTGEVVGETAVAVKGEAGRGYWVSHVTPHADGSVFHLEGEVETVLVSDGVTAAAVGEVGRAHHPHKSVGRVVEEKLDLVGLGVGAGDGVHLPLDGGDEVLVLHRGECLALLLVEVHVRDKETGVHVGGGQSRSGSGVHGELVGGEGVVVTEGGVGGTVHHATALGHGAESHLDLDLVVGQGDKGDRKTVLHEVLVEPERHLHVKLTLLAGELDHVLLHVSGESELTDLLTEASAGALGEFLPEEHPLSVKGVDLGTSDLDLNLRHDSVSDGVHPVSGLVGGGDGVTRSVGHGGGGLDGGESHLEEHVAHEVTVTAHIGRHALAEANGSGAEVVLFEVLGEVGVTLVLALEKSHFGVSVDVVVLATLGGNLDNSSSSIY